MKIENHFLEIITSGEERFYIPRRSIERLEFDADKTITVYLAKKGYSHQEPIPHRFRNVSNIDAISRDMNGMVNHYSD